MKISTKIWILVTAVLSLAALAIKLYFLPAAERFSKLTVEEQMQRDMVAFEQIIGVVVTAANGDKEYVRRALYAIGADKSIPIELRRSEFLHEQFGRRKDREPKNEFEAEVLASGIPRFRTTEKFIEYAYPLKAQGVCMGCHIDTAGKSIPFGTPVGLAIRRVPVAAVTDSRAAYFTLDLFWQNFALVLLAVLLTILPIYLWILRPIHLMAQASEKILRAAEEQTEADPMTDFEIASHGKDTDELHALKRLIDYARRRLHSK